MEDNNYTTEVISLEDFDSIASAHPTTTIGSTISSANVSTTVSTSNHQNLSPEQRTFVDEVAAKLDLRDSAAIMGFGAPVQNKISKFSDNMLQNVRTKDTGEVGKDLTNLVTTIKDFDTSADQKPKFSLFRNTKRSVDKMIANYSSIETNIDKVVNNLEGHQRSLLKDVNMLDTMYNTNYEYFKELSLYIIAGEQRLEDFRNNEIPAQQRRAEESSNQM
jgi:uncharacterized protein YaaN involved in tellurite resistance